MGKASYLLKPCYNSSNFPPFHHANSPLRFLQKNSKTDDYKSPKTRVQRGVHLPQQGNVLPEVLLCPVSKAIVRVHKSGAADHKGLGVLFLLGVLLLY